jgi:precorrin-6B methylase 1
VDFGPSVALVTGDPGLFSLAKPVIDRFGRERCRIIPGISSVQLAFAAAGLTWEDARIVSAHKEYPDTREWAHWDKIAVLGGKRDFLTRVAADLAAAHRNSRFFICEDLSLPTERVIETDHAGLSRFNAGSRTIVLIIRDGKPE